MEFDDSNHKVYNKQSIVSFYSAWHGKLFIPEIIIFVKYKEYIYNKRILDIGCGAGRTSFFLTNFTKFYTGIDYSCKLIEACKERFKDARFICCDVRDMSVFEAQTFDFILFSFNGLDYISHDNRQRALHEIHRVLANKGTFVFSTHNRNYKNATHRPRWKFCLSPTKQAKEIVKFTRSIYNHAKNKKHQHFEEKYSIINDNAMDYSLLTYYVSKEAQISALAEVGFETIDMFSKNGESLIAGSQDCDIPWIYFVTKKTDGAF